MSDKETILVLRPRARSQIVLLIGSLAFVVAGLWLGIEGNAIGFVCAAFFALGIPISVIQLIPGSSYLLVTHEGLTVRTLFRRWSVSWHDIDSFFVVTLRRHGMSILKMVGFDYVASYDRSRITRALASQAAGCEASLPDTYGRTAEDLAAFLNQCLVEVRQAGAELRVEGEPPRTPRGTTST